ncbi:MAG: hypothetical protein K2X39_05315, partial [Silvanigrellaceae bacterium]|nr:hypothetical protein [Silvanigrellaceae bacterium]
MSVFSYAFITLLPLFLTSCTVGFSNSLRQLDSRYAKIFIPSAYDSSSFGGQASRLSMAVRTLLSKKTDIEISDLDEARWAISIKIMQRNQLVTQVDDCINTSSKATQTVGNGSILCSNENFNR